MLRSLASAQRVVIGVGIANFVAVFISYEHYKTSRPKWQPIRPPTEEHRLAVFDLLSDEQHRKDIRANEDSTSVTKLRQQQFKRVRGHVVDIASGVGTSLEALLQVKAGIKSVTFIDKQSAPLHVLKELIEEKKPPFPVLLIEADCTTKLPFPDDCFDTVLCSFALCSVENPSGAVKEMHRLLKPHGRLYAIERGEINTTFTRWLLKYLKLYPNPRIPWEFGYFEDRNPKNLLQTNNFKIIEHKAKRMGDIHLIIAQGLDMGIKQSNNDIGSKSDEFHLSIIHDTDTKTSVFHKYSPTTMTSQSN